MKEPSFKVTESKTKMESDVWASQERFLNTRHPNFVSQFAPSLSHSERREWLEWLFPLKYNENDVQNLKKIDSVRNSDKSNTPLSVNVYFPWTHDNTCPAAGKACSSQHASSMYLSDRFCHIGATHVTRWHMTHETDKPRRFHDRGITWRTKNGPCGWSHHHIFFIFLSHSKLQAYQPFLSMKIDVFKVRMHHGSMIIYPHHAIAMLIKYYIKWEHRRSFQDG